MKNRIVIFFRTLLFVICIGTFVCISITAVKSRILNIDFKENLSVESTADVTNPYRGFYDMHGYTLTDNPDDVHILYDTITDTDNNLFLFEVNLMNYADSNISENALKSLDLLLWKLRLEDKQIILRFLYDWDGKAVETEPTDIKRITSHMEQLAGTVNKYKDNIFTLQGIFTGNYGEMNGSNYTSEEDISLLMNTLATVIDPEIYLSARTPAQLRGILKSHRPLAYNSPYSGTLPARLGLYNDGMLGSSYDLGTYDDTSYKDYKVFLDAGTREEELEFQNELCNYVPNGGEVVIDNTYNDIENAVKDLNTMHISYLNNSHDENVLTKWKNSEYKHVNGYEYIAAHLGYRYVITDCSIDFHPFLDSSASISFIINNTGFAPAYKQFDTELIFRNSDTKKEDTFNIVFDNRGLRSNQSMVLNCSLPVRDYEPGTYDILLTMNDNVLSVPIIFGNKDASSELKIGTLTIN